MRKKGYSAILAIIAGGTVMGIFIAIVIGFFWYTTAIEDSAEDIRLAVLTYRQNADNYSRIRVDSLIMLIENSRIRLSTIKDKKLRQQKIRKLQNQWIKRLSLYRYGKNRDGYLFVNKLLDINGGTCFARRLVFPLNPSLIGNCLDSNEPDKKGFYFRKVYLADIKKKGYSFIDYYYQIPGTNKFGKKTGYMRLYKPWNWIIGTGVYYKDMKPILQAQKSIMAKKLKKIWQIIAAVILVTIILSVIASAITLRFINKLIGSLFDDLDDALKRARFLDTGKYRFKETKRLAAEFNEAINQFKVYENEFLESFVAIMETRDGYTKGHSQRVAYYAQKIAKALGMNERLVDTVYRAGLIHDIGKIGIPDNILLKPGRLSENEYRIIKFHPLFSYEIIKNLEHFKYLAPIVRSHHEKIDGSGYPDALRNGEIPIESRILAVADIFDALTTTRPYRKAFSLQDAIEILRTEKIDQEIVSKSEKLLIKSFEKDKYMRISSLSKEMDDIRGKILVADYMTGLIIRSKFLKNVQKLIDKKQRLVFVRIDIKNLSVINYNFSNMIGNKVIIHTANALKQLAEKNAIIKPGLFSRSYADVFYLAHRLPEKNAQKENEMQKRMKQIIQDAFLNELSKDPDCQIKAKDGRKLSEYIDFNISYAIYPDEAEDIKALLYIAEMAKRFSSTSITHTKQ